MYIIIVFILLVTNYLFLYLYINFLFLIFSEFATYHLPSYHGSGQRLHKTKGGRVWNSIFTNQQEPEMATLESHYCYKCGKVYSRKGNLQRHLSWECGKEPHQKCPYCPYATNRKTNVQEHIRRRHKDMPNIA
jgi:hypothetical protein